VRKVNQILRRNRRILETLVPAKEETAKISRNKLRDKGFNFDYFTNTYTTRKETVYFYCYEYGYLLLEDDWCLLVRRKEQMT
jgi:hypothetical protein